MDVLFDGWPALQCWVLQHLILDVGRVESVVGDLPSVQFPQQCPKCEHIYGGVVALLHEEFGSHVNRGSTELHRPCIQLVLHLLNELPAVWPARNRIVSDSAHLRPKSYAI